MITALVILLLIFLAEAIFMTWVGNLWLETWVRGY